MNPDLPLNSKFKYQTFAGSTKGEIKKYTRENSNSKNNDLQKISKN